MTLPAPLTPPDCDLRDFDYMPLVIGRLRDSDAAAMPNAEAFRAAVLAWAASWHQVPAASLPDDDSAITRLVGMGKDVDGFVALRAAGALRGFVKCSDGRLYHPVVAERALISWAAKATQRNRTAKARAAYIANHPPKTKAPARKKAVTERVTAPVTRSETESKVSEGKGSEGIAKKTEAPTVPVVALVVARPLPTQIPEWIPVIPWDAFVAMRKKARKPLTDRALELMIGKLGKLRAAGEDVGAILDQSTLAVWADVYPLKNPQGKQNGNRSNPSFGSSLYSVVEERAAQRAAVSDRERPGWTPDDGLEGILEEGNPQPRLAHHRG